MNVASDVIISVDRIVVTSVVILLLVFCYTFGRAGASPPGRVYQARACAAL